MHELNNIREQGKKEEKREERRAGGKREEVLTVRFYTLNAIDVMQTACGVQVMSAAASLPSDLPLDSVLCPILSSLHISSYLIFEIQGRSSNFYDLHLAFQRASG